jgi:hypothetical protein
MPHHPAPPDDPPPLACDRLTRGGRALPNDKEALVSDLVAIAYPDVSTARQVAANVGEAQKAHLIELDDMVIVEHRENGKIKLYQPSPRAPAPPAARCGAA